MSRSMPLLADDLFPMSSSDESVATQEQKKEKTNGSKPHSSTDQTAPSTSSSTTKRRHAECQREKKDKRVSDNEASVVPKKRTNNGNASHSRQSSSTTKKTHINPVPTVPKLTSKELFGSDSEDDVDVEAQTNKVNINFKQAQGDHAAVIKCDKCNIILSKREYQYHLRTNLHKSNCLIRTEFDNVYIIATAFKNRVMTYQVLALRNNYTTPESFLIEYESDITKLIDISLKKHTCIKTQFELYANFLLPKNGEQQLKSFNTKFEIICNTIEFSNIYKDNTIDTIKRKFSEFEHCESGWTFLSISHLEININKYCPMRGGTYITLPQSIKKSKSCVNVRNNDEFCFLWSILAGLFPCINNVCRTKSYPHYSTVFNINDMSFPLSHQDIKKFEMCNQDISVNIYGLDKKNKVTGPLYLTQRKKINHINLLYFESNNQGHYCFIKDLLKLVRPQVTKHRGSMFLCESCLQIFKSFTKHKNHYCTNVLTVLPQKNSVLNFKNYDRQQKIHFVIYADFESLLENYSDINSSNTNTVKFKKHKPTCFGYYICCSYNSTLNKYVTYRGTDATEVFIKWLMEDIERIHNILKTYKHMLPLSDKQQNDFKRETSCHICKHYLFGDKVRDHDHVTGEYRGAAHSYCNLTYKICPFIPVVFHNLCGYDSHLFIMELAKHDGSIYVIPKTKEKYITITKTYEISNQNKEQVRIKFIDSFQFLSSSLDKLSKSLNDSDFIHLSQICANSKQLSLLRQKGIYPYDYIDCFLKYDETQLPPQECFYNSLKKQHITNVEYSHAREVWNNFEIFNLGDYTQLYLKCDVLLLCDVFENFRKMSLYHYNLDPAYYVTSPGLSWDAMLLYTKVQLELISNLEIYQMLEKGIRGGLAQCSLRHAKANNKYLENFESSKPSSYLLYLDCNNLYGYAMMKKLPISDFRFLTQNEINCLNVLKVSDKSDIGYILEVDLEYPDYLHDYHSDLPFAVEKYTPPGGKSQKLIANLYDKYFYVIHYVHLKECLKQGLRLKKIHRVISFSQDNFLKKYIDLNTILRQAAKSDFEKDFFKLLNNSIFGKTIENKHKQVNVKLVTDWVDKKNKTNKTIGAQKLIAKPNLKSLSIFSENFLAIQLNLEKISLDRPIYIGFTVLEYAKQHMYRFHYNFIKKEYGNNAKLCYTDTDSLLYLIKTEDVYDDIKNQINLFDTSNFDLNNVFGIPQVNNKIPGLFKDEMGGKLLTEFVGLRAKVYCIKSVNDEINKAKGISKCITNRLKCQNYLDCLLKDKDYKSKVNLIKSIKHTLYSEEVNKLVLNRNDDKRYILSNQIETKPWGHYAYIG